MVKSHGMPKEEVLCVRSRDFGFLKHEDQPISQPGFHVAIPNMDLVRRLVVAHPLGRPAREGGSPAPPPHGRLALPARGTHPVQFAG